MFRIKFLLAIIISFNLFVDVSSAEGMNLRTTAEYLLSVPVMTDLKISPDGEYISYLSTIDGKRNIFLMSTKDTITSAVTQLKEFGIIDYYWCDDDYIVYTVDESGTGNFDIYSIDIEGEDKETIFSDINVRTEIVDPMPDGGGQIIFKHNGRMSSSFDYYTCDIDGDDREQILKNPGNIIQIVLDQDGEILAALSADGINRRLLYREDTDMPFDTVITYECADAVDPRYLDEDNQIIALSNFGRDKTTLVSIDPESGVETVLAENKTADIMDFDFSVEKGVSTYAYYRNKSKERIIIDKKAELVIDKISKHISDYLFDIVSETPNGELLVIKAYSDVQPGKYYLYSVSLDKIKFIGEQFPGLDESLLAPTEYFTFKSRDGLKLDGYITKSTKLRSMGNPLIVKIDDSFLPDNLGEFDPEAQLFASAGFIVLKVNTRGSAGRGKEFERLAYKFGRKKVVDDIADAVYLLVKQRIVMRERVFVVGCGLGGLTMLNTMSMASNLFRAGTAINPVSDPEVFIKSLPPYLQYRRKSWYMKLCDPQKNSAIYSRIAPVLSYKKIKRPVLFAYDDKNAGQSEKLTDLLKETGSKYELYNITDESDKAEMFNRIILFFNQQKK